MIEVTARAGKGVRDMLFDLEAAERQPNSLADFERRVLFPEPTLAHFSIYWTGVRTGYRWGKDDGSEAAYREVYAKGKPTARQVAKRVRARKRR